MGDTVNVAARLQTTAAPGQVLVGPTTYAQTAEVVRYESLGSIEARGREGRVEAYIALETLAPSVLALAVWSTAFTSVAIATGFERRYGVLERLASTPLGRTGLLAGKALAVVLVVVGQLVVLSTAALLLGWRPAPTAGSALAAVVLVVLAAAAFVSLALLLAGRLRAEATLGLANLVYVVLLVGGGLVLPLSRYPAVLRPVLELLPTAAQRKLPEFRLSKLNEILPEALTRMTSVKLS